MSPAKQSVSDNGNSTLKKSSVAQTCNQLSLFLKQNGCLRDLHLGIHTVKSPAGRMTIDLLSNMDNSGQIRSVNSVAESESKTAQMTIFYNGQVIVLDNILEDRAKDVMLAAGSYTGKTELTPNSNRYSDSKLRTNSLDLPIARRASLHKFLAKRKDRATLRAPYQLHNPSPMAGDLKNEHMFDLNL